MDVDSHKLCGFLRAVLAVSSSSSAPESLVPSTALCFAGDASFRSADGRFLLRPLPDLNAAPSVGAAASPRVSTAGKGPGADPGPAAASNSLSSSSRKRRRRRGGAAMVNGSISVVQHLHELVKHRCLKIEARVVGVSGFRAGGRGAAPRAVVLVDVYLPVAAWSDWQFPKCRALVASVFKHVSCDWEVRKSLLALDWMSGNYPNDDASVWDCCDCHVLGCRLHCSTSVSGKNKLFDLHEIFKSLPSIAKEMKMPSTRIKPLDESFNPGIWDIADDVLTNVLSQLGPKDLVRVAGTCNHLRHLTASIIPCMKLKLFPHQEAAVEWMLKREQSCEILKHPMYMEFMTEDGFPLYINSVSGDISTGMAPNINDFRGGMFCDEPGLGKTVTSLSLILKTHGTFADPPHGVEVIWCMNNMDQKCGYYEVNAVNSSSSNFMSSRKRFVGVDGRQGWLSEKTEISSCTSSSPVPITCVLRHTRTRSSSARRNILCAYGDPLFCDKRKAGENIISKTYKNEEQLYPGEDVHDNKKLKKDTDDVPDNKKLKKDTDVSETWVQCDACRKWRKISDRIALDSAAAWFCSMNNDPLHQNCRDPEESWDYKTKITYLPGFYTKGTRDGLEQNISFFTSVLKEHFWVFDSETKKALNWLAKLSHRKLQEMEKNGCPVLGALDLNLDSNGYHKIFQAFGLVCRNDRSVSRWYYPSNLDNLEFDSTALKIALTKPLDIQRFYLSRATLIVVPTNLIDHWKTQIQKHVSPGQLRVYVWADQKKPCAHTLAWDYDIVITTFSRLSAEWGPRKRSVLMQVHWLRVMLDEGHTLGSSLNLTNKLQMAISLHASYRWILTGTPTPNTPNSQVSHLQSMLKFLHEEAYGQNQESWESGILRPFEAQMEEGRLRLIQLLQRSMISSRKVDIKNIPPCIKKITYVEFTEEHARSYNELVVTVRRNILMADWNDPSHVESLLNPKQWKYRSNTIRNVRLSCCVAGHVKVADAGQDIQETMDILVQLGLDPLSEEYLFIKGSLVAGCRCFRCKDWCRLPIITPCRHLLCIDCIQLDSEKCTMHGCGNFYEMQSPETLARPENPNPKWPVPKDLIELQPSYKQDDWDPDWQSTSSSKVAYVVEKLKDLRELNRKIGHGHDKVYDSNVPLYSDKSLTSLSHLGGVKQDTELCTTSVDKVIIFSQFLEHIHVIEQQLAIAGITYIGMYSPMPSSNKMDSLMVFQQDPNCMVLLMDGSAALGLDLSFVTYVFLMEPIWDRSMEEQVISRAHRMGATRPINVETLAMRGTIEEQMLDFLQAGNACQSTLTQEINRDNYEGTRAPRSLHDFAESNYLAHLSFVRKKL